MLRNFVSVILGVVAGSFLFSLIQLANYLIVPLPEGNTGYATLSTREFVGNMSYPAWAVLIVSYMVGSVAAGYVSGKLAESTTLIFPLFVAVFFVLAWIVRISAVPHPLWVVVVVILIFLPFTLAGHRLALLSRELA